MISGRAGAVARQVGFGLVIPALLAGAVFVQTRAVWESTSETYDEYTYLQLGVRVYRHNDFACLASPMCPPLPILLEYWLPALRARFEPRTEGWESAVPEMTRQARFLTATSLGIPLVLVAYAWIARRRGGWAGALGGALVALSPSVLAAASIATTDACFALFGVVALAGLGLYGRRPSWWSYLLAGGGLGLALGSKQTAAILFVVALGEVVLRPSPPREPGWTDVDVALRWIWRAARRWGGLVALAFLVDSALYGFHTAGSYYAVGVTTTVPVIIPMVANLFPNGEAFVDVVRRLGPPLAYDTFIGQLDHAANGHAAFLMGQHARHGWWYFFPVAIVIKSTPVELALIGLALGLAVRPATWRDPARRLWLLGAGILLAAGMASSINIGHRYMLLIYPLVILVGADWLGALATRHARRAVALGVALLAGQAASAVMVAPHYLAYFNGFIGGPMEGYRYLVDSSLDWGQDLPALRRELEARHYHQVALGYFGTAQSRTYGLRAVEFTPGDDAVAAATDWLAISATSLMGAYGDSSSLYERFKGFPSARAGYSIFLYDLSNPAIRASWDELRHANQFPVPEPPDRRSKH